MPRTKRAPKVKATGVYQHPEAESPMRPEVGTQAQFKKKKPPQKYRYDSSLLPSLEWDGQNPAREQGEAAMGELMEGVSSFKFQVSGKTPTEAEWKQILRKLETRNSKLGSAQARLRALSRPFLNWSGKAERFSFDVPTLPEVKVDQRGNELLVVKRLKEGKV